MFNKKIKNMGFEFDEKCETDLKNLFEYFSRRKGFGNGRFVDKLIQETILKHAINESPSINRIVKEDIPSIREMNNASDPEENTDDLLLNIVGLENLKTKIKEFEEYVKFIKLAEKNNITIPDQNLHMIFTGNPGTGKTTIARIMAKILYNAGVIHENKLIEVERKDLIGQYIGQTAPKTYEVIARAIGGILFIDEAYSLSSDSKNDYGSEAIATLIKAMEDHKGEFVVIFAGYKKEMKEFIDMNSGIASRIGYTFEFEDYNKEELTEIFLKKVSKSNLTITDEAKEKVKSLMSYFVGVENIGNGRFADKVYMNTLVKHAKNNSKNISVITEDDIPSVKEMTDTIFNGNNMINPDEIDEKAYRKTAIHEIGHALVRYVLYNEPGILKITINPEGRGTLGYVMYKDSKVSYVNSKSELLNKIKVSLAGMGAEELFIGEFANGNTSDLEKATTIAKNMVTKFGMSRFGIGQIDNISGELATRVTEEINYILDDCYTDTKKILADNKNKVLALVDYVLDKKEISEEEFINVIKQKEV
jgi:AAA+ superfamily predicted ATPase